MPGVIDTNIEHGVLSLRMNRPSKKNALTDAMYHALADAMEAAEQVIIPGVPELDEAEAPERTRPTTLPYACSGLYISARVSCGIINGISSVATAGSTKTSRGRLEQWKITPLSGSSP